VSLVLDTSLTLSWYLEDEVTVAADAVLDQVLDSGAIVPELWRIARPGTQECFTQ
jgi:hypothetical protein